MSRRVSRTLRDRRRARLSMPEQELFRVNENPPQVLDGLAAVGGGGEVLDGGRELGGVRLAGEGDRVKLAGDLLGRLVALGEPGHPAGVVAELAVDGGAADELEGLGEVRVALSLALAGE